MQRTYRGTKVDTNVMPEQREGGPKCKRWQAGISTDGVYLGSRAGTGNSGRIRETKQMTQQTLNKRLDFN